MKLKTKILAFLGATTLAFTSVTATFLASETIANAADLTGSITIDTANYKMDKGGIYDIGITVKRDGTKLSGDEVKNLVENGVIKVEDSRTGSIVDLTQLSNGNFRVKGKNYGTCYITYRILDGNKEVNHASVKIDVEKGVKQGGTSVRNTSVFDSKLLSLASSSNSNYADLVGVYEFRTINPAGDKALYQLKLDDNLHSSLIIYTDNNGIWQEQDYYDGGIKTLSDVRANFDVEMKMYVLDKNGTATKKIEGYYNIKENTLNDAKTLTLSLIDGDMITDDHMHEPITFTKTSTAVKNGEKVDGFIETGVYYDKKIYESGDFDAHFVGIALNDAGNALLTIQDYGTGTWSEDGALNITGHLQLSTKMNQNGDTITLSDGTSFVKAPENIWPEGFLEFMKTSKIPEYLI